MLIIWRCSEPWSYWLCNQHNLLWQNCFIASSCALYSVFLHVYCILCCLQQWSKSVVHNRWAFLPRGASVNFLGGTSPYMLYNVQSLNKNLPINTFVFKAYLNKGQLLKGGMGEKRFRTTDLIGLYHKLMSKSWTLQISTKTGQKFDTNGSTTLMACKH